MSHNKDVKRTLKNERLEYPIKMMHAYPSVNVGWGAHTMIGNDARSLGMTNVLIVTTGLRGTGITDTIQGVLKAAEVDSEVFSGVTPNPKDHEVMAGAKLLASGKFDGLLSIGGGSSHDACKAIRLVHSHDGQDVRSFEGAFKATKANTLPHLAINTTSGTGSEVSCFSIINHTDKKYKMALFDPNCTPSKSVNDPLIHQCMPGNLAAYTGMDALAHGVEAITSRLGVVSAYGPGLSAISLIFGNLRQSSMNRNNDKAVEAMVWAEMAAAYSFNSAGLGLIHSMAHALGGMYDAPHGLCNAIGLGPVMAFNLPACPERFRMMAEAAGINTVGMSDMKAGQAFIDACLELKAELGITKTFSDLGLLEKDIEGLSKFAVNDICTEGNPTDTGLQDMIGIFKQCL
jgi:alcohol dehydrogenase class IV